MLLYLHIHFSKNKQTYNIIHTMIIHKCPDIWISPFLNMWEKWSQLTDSVHWQIGERKHCATLVCLTDGENSSPSSDTSIKQL